MDPLYTRNLAHDLEIVQAHMDRLVAQQIVLDERQRKEMLSLTRAFLLVDQAVTELRKQVQEDRKSDAAQDAKLIQAETLLNEVRVWIRTAVLAVVGGFILIIMLLFVIAMR